MSPEQERMTTYLRPASDQYSLGLVAFEMLTGQIYKRIGLRQGAHLLAAHTAPVQALVTTMLADDPDDRYPTMAAVVHALRAIERQIASAETQIGPRAGAETLTSQEDEETLIATQHDTPRVGLQPMPPVAASAPPPAVPSAVRYSRRGVLIGVGGLVVAAGTAGVAGSTIFFRRDTGSGGKSAIVTHPRAVGAIPATVQTTTASALLTTQPTATTNPPTPTGPLASATPAPTAALPSPTPPLPTATTPAILQPTAVGPNKGVQVQRVLTNLPAGSSVFYTDMQSSASASVDPDRIYPAAALY